MLGYVLHDQAPLVAVEGILVLLLIIRQIEFEYGFHVRWVGGRDLRLRPKSRHHRAISTPTIMRRNAGLYTKAGILAGVIIHSTYPPVKSPEKLIILKTRKKFRAHHLSIM